MNAAVRTRDQRQARRLCMVAAVPTSLTTFIAPHVRALSGTADITLVASTAPDPTSGALPGGVRFHPQHIARGVSIQADMRSLVRLWVFFRRERFDLVQSITPKAGLLAMVAARLAGVPVRIHWFTGQVWATRRGTTRLLLKTMDRVLAAAATHLLADSASQRAFLEREGVVGTGRVTVLCDGSVCGVDTSRFRPDAATSAAVRDKLGIPAAAIVALYVGRLNTEKGLPELAAAFGCASPICRTLHLLIVGPDEGGLKQQILRCAGDAKIRLHFVGQTSRPEAYMAAADFLVLPSHREGFGATVIEAAACGLPAIGTRIYGLTDAIVDGETGILVPVGDEAALTNAMLQLATDGGLCRRMGAVARRRAKMQFDQSRLTAALLELHDRIALQGARHD